MANHKDAAETMQGDCQEIKLFSFMNISILCRTKSVSFKQLWAVKKTSSNNSEASRCIIKALFILPNYPTLDLMKIAAFLPESKRQIHRFRLLYI